MKINAASISSVRSFGAEQRIRFDTMRPGLYHVAGRNELEPWLEGNAVGKTSLFKAIFWALFNEDDEGLLGPALKNWHSKELMQVVLDAHLPSGRFGINRTWKPNVLEVAPISSDGYGESEPYDQAQFERGLGITASGFLYSRYFAQFTPAFVDLKPAAQTALFSDVLLLDVWERAAKSASAAATAAERELSAAREALAGLKGQAAELVRLSEEHEKAERAWVGIQQGVINSALNDIRQRKQELGKAQAAHTAANAKAAEYIAYKDEYDTALRLYDRADAEEHRTDAAVRKLERDDYTNCPECGSPVTKAHVKAELETARRAYNEARALYEKHRKEFTRLEKLSHKYKRQREELSTAEQALGFAQANLQAAKLQHEELLSHTNPYADMLQEIEQRGPQLVAEIEAAAAECAELERRVRGAQFWPTGFKEIRLGLIRDSLAQLTLESNEALFQLGLRDWAVSFDVEKETQSGTIKSGFTTLIRAPGSKDSVPFKAYCGGERQRLRVATSIGFANLINSRQGIEPNVEFWDEPIKHVGPGASHDFLSMLADRAERYQRVILLADHRVLDFGGFAGTITIVKDKNGSRIEA